MLTPSTGTVGIRPKQFVEQHDYHIVEQGKVQDTHDNNRYIGLYSTTAQQIWADAMLSRQIYEEEQKQFEKQMKQVENKRSSDYHFNPMGQQTTPNQTNFVRKNREDSITYFEVPYRTEMQTPKSDKFTPERQATRKGSPNKEVNGLDNKHLNGQAIIEHSLDRYDNPRSGRCDCNEGSNDLKFMGYFQGKPI